MQDLNVALIQRSLYWEDRDKNLNAFNKLFSTLRTDTRLVVLPEMFATGFSMDCHHHAELPDGESFGWMQKSALRLNAHISGSLMIREGKHYFNRLFLVAPDGSFEYYDKRHLFRMGDEHLHFSQGKRRVVARIGEWKILLQVCYDLRFPVWMMNRYDKGSFDYDAILLVANWPAPRARVWKTLLQARAIDNQCYVIGVNRTGTDGREISYQGDSLVVSPRGEAIADCLTREEQVAYATLSRGHLDQFRDQFRVSLDWDTFQITV